MGRYVGKHGGKYGEVFRINRDAPLVNTLLNLMPSVLALYRVCLSFVNIPRL